VKRETGCAHFTADPALTADDCDGETDEDPGMCPQGQTCAAGSCVDSSSVTLDPGAAGTTATGNQGGGGTAGTGTGTAATSGNSSVLGRGEASGCAWAPAPAMARSRCWAC
jgi:hypothetical protein